MHKFIYIYSFSAYTGIHTYNIHFTVNRKRRK